MKVDVTKIEGYADMTPEEKLEAIENFEFADPDMSEYVSKKTFDKAVSDLNKKKKELADKMTEDEKKSLADKEALEAMQKELSELRMERKIAENKAKYLGLGYSEELASDTAKALAEEDYDRVFKNQKAHLDAYEKSIKADMVSKTPRQSGGGNPADNGMTKEKLMKMPMKDREAFYRANPEEYKTLMEEK